MMKKKTLKRLTLHRETLSVLDAAQLQAAAGAGPTLSCYRSCDVPCRTVERSYCVGVCQPL